MAKQRYGPASEKIKVSKGPCKENPTNMYHTSYINSFKSGILEKHQLKSAHKTHQVNRPTGYNANFRPCIYYTPSMDNRDNPALKMNVQEHYLRSHDSDFRPYWVSPTGTEMNLRNHDIIPSASGFTTMMKPEYIKKTSTEVKNAHGHVCPRAKLNLDLNDPISQENQGTGPTAMSTENDTRYKGEQGRWPSQSWRFHKSVGHKEPTATTRVEPFDPIEYRTRNPYRYDIWNVRDAQRKIGISEQQDHFRQSPFHKNLPRTKANGIPEPVPRSQRKTGYTYETTKPRYTDMSKSANFNDDGYLSQTRSDPYSITCARYSFTAPAASRSIEERGGHKETTGYVKNHPFFSTLVVTPAQINQRFITHYGSVFTEEQGENKAKAAAKATLALSKGGWPVAKATNGFTKSTRVHTF